MRPLGAVNPAVRNRALAGDLREGVRRVGGGVRRLLGMHAVLGEGELLNEVGVLDELVGAVPVLDDRRQGLDPVAGVQVMHLAQHLVRGCVNMPAHHASAAPGAGQFRNVLLEVRDMAHGRLHAGLDGPAEGPVLEPPPRAPHVVGAIDRKERLVAPVAEVRQEHEVLRHRVEDVAVEDEVASLHALVDVLVHDREVLELEREELGEDVVVVAAEVDDLRVPLLEHLQDDADEVRVGLRPLAVALQLPAVDDVSIQYQLLAAHVAQEVVNLCNLGIDRSQVDVG